MRRYESKEDLKNEINKSFEKYILKFDNILEFLVDKRVEVKMPTNEFKWNQLGDLYSWFTEDELFKPHMRRWADGATKTAVWKVYKFIHMNTVDSSGTFVRKIRKLKKLVL